MHDHEEYEDGETPAGCSAAAIMAIGIILIFFLFFTKASIAP